MLQSEFRRLEVEDKELKFLSAPLLSGGDLLVGDLSLEDMIIGEVASKRFSGVYLKAFIIEMTVFIHDMMLSDKSGKCVGLLD